MTSEAVYDDWGVGYSAVRKPDPRIAARIESALKGCKSVITVGAGTGSYEPRGARHVAVEPSEEMIRQRPSGAPLCTRGVAQLRKNLESGEWRRRNSELSGLEKAKRGIG